MKKKAPEEACPPIGSDQQTGYRQKRTAFKKNVMPLQNCQTKQSPEPVTIRGFVDEAIGNPRGA
jgi:hypothetical protein